jgi:predicted NUDIX family NTP pyrophosphohydrolase
MVKQSAGLLLFRRRDAAVEVFLVHPGGPFWKKKDNGAWSIPKGEFANGEDPLEAARREFLEETGYSVDGKFTALKPVKQRGGKVVHAWLVEADVDAANVTSNTFLMEWPRSGQIQTFPEVDRAAWFSFEEAREKILESQLPLLDEAQSLVTQRSV